VGPAAVNLAGHVSDLDLVIGAGGGTINGIGASTRVMIDFMAGGGGAFHESSDGHGGTIVSQGRISVDLLHVSMGQISKG